MGIKLISLAAIALVLSTSINAAPVYSTGAGTAVISTDFSATFELLGEDQTLSNYQEGGLTFNTIGDSNSSACNDGTLCNNHSGFQGMSGGIYYLPQYGAIITATNNESFSAFEVMVGTGYSDAILHGVWETYSLGVLTGSGVFDESVGTIVGLSDAAGFDEVRIGTYRQFCVNTMFGGCTSATALDFASAQLLTTVPIPSAVWLFGSGLVGLIGVTRRKS